MAGEPDSGEWLLAGKITGCHGIKGWVKIHSFTEPMENFLGFGGWMLNDREGFRPICFDTGKRQGKGLVAHIKGVDDRTLAESFKGQKVWIAKASLPSLDDGDYYWSQLQGLQVWCHEGESKVLLGVVDYLIDTGANDVLVVKACEGSLDERERLIPYLVDDVVTRVDLDEAVIEVDWHPED